jgi:hypothetical protein
MTSGQEAEEFINLGMQYYVAGRALSWAGVLPVAGNLYHHSLEMLLKACLSRKYSLADLKKKFRHRLGDAWIEFKMEYPDPELCAFDDTIVDIEEFEEIRYPNRLLKHGAAMIVDYRGTTTPPRTSGSSPRPEREYRFYFDDVDRLIGAIFTASGKNPFYFTSGLKPDVQEMLARDNPAAKQLLMNRA